MPPKSDWIAFLQEEVSYFKEVVLFIAATVLSIVVVIATIPATGNIIVFIGKLVLIGISYGIFLYFFNKAKKRKKPYQDLIMKIMREELTTHKEILAEYNKIPPKKF